MSRHTISRSDLKRFDHKNLEDETVLDIASRTTGVGIEQLIRSGAALTSGQIHEAHIDHIYERFWITGRIPKRIRQNIVDMLLGHCIIYIDKDCTQAGLLA